MDTLFHALVRYLAPVLVFTAEEAWGTRYPDGGSVHLLEWPEVPNLSLLDDDQAKARWYDVRQIRSDVLEAIEPKRRSKELGSSLQAAVRVGVRNREVRENLALLDMAEICIVSSFEWMEPEEAGTFVAVSVSDDAKCGRCWRLLPEVPEDGALCDRCADVVPQVEGAQ